MFLATILALTLVWFVGEMNLSLREHYASLSPKGAKKNDGTSKDDNTDSKVSLRPKHGLVRKR